MVESSRVLAAYEQARRDLLGRRDTSGHWVGHLASSSLSTATALSALSLVKQRSKTTAPGREAGDPREALLSSRIVEGLRWLASMQNDDGGFGDTDKSVSNIATTMLVRAAFHLSGATADHAQLLQRADSYIDTQGGVPALRRCYGKDKTFAVPILTNCALAGLVSWREVAPLPFELACLPQWLLGIARLPVVSYAIPALVAIGQARHFHRKPINPLTRLIRAVTARKSLEVAERMQPQSGGFLEATPLTSFVVMSLAGVGNAEHAIVRRGVDFLLASARDDGSWPIDTNLATWTTTLALGALSLDDQTSVAAECLDWLLTCQHRVEHPFTAAAPGGWGWTDLSGGVPDADDTSGALLALAACRASFDQSRVEQIDGAARDGIKWLVNLQNRDGGWPTFCRGWGALPFDRSAADLTAHALRALFAWRTLVPQLEQQLGQTPDVRESSVPLGGQIEQAIQRGTAYLARTQRDDGSWVPLWFGNQFREDEENPVYGTSRVLCAYRDLERLDTSEAQRAFRWLVGNQNSDGGWGGGPASRGEGNAHPWRSSVEETALAVEALTTSDSEPARSDAVARGVAWLVDAVESGQHGEASPIGFYFANLWYYEDLYPLIFTVSALGRIVRRLSARTEPVVMATSTHNA